MEPPRCALCGSASRLACPGSSPIYHCTGCGVAWSPPAAVPPVEEFFSEDYYDLYYAPRAAALTASFGAHLDALGPYLSGSRWLDVGCGGGYFASVAGVRGWEVTGTDPSGAAIRQARRTAPRARFVRGLVGDLPLDPAFDVISFWDSIVYAPDLEGLLRDCVARLSDGGALLVKTPHMPARFLKAARHLLGWRPTLRDDVTQVRATRWFLTPGPLGDLLRRHGLGVVHWSWSREVPFPEGRAAAGRSLKGGARQVLTRATRAFIGRNECFVMVARKCRGGCTARPPVARSEALPPRGEGQTGAGGRRAGPGEAEGGVAARGRRATDAAGRGLGEAGDR
jgi:SAM-dependent methyltransferase